MKTGVKNGIFVCEKVSEYLRFPLKDDHSAPFVPCGQELSSVVELNSGDDISWGGGAAIETKMRGLGG